MHIKAWIDNTFWFGAGMSAALALLYVLLAVNGVFRVDEIAAGTSPLL